MTNVNGEEAGTAFKNGSENAVFKGPNGASSRKDLVMVTE
jgi:hypothetical protein